MATFRSGNGGSISVGATSLDIATWTLNTGGRLTENTHSGTSGASNYELVVVDASWTVEVPLDETALPDTDLGLTAGAKVTITFKIGAGAKTYVLTNTTVEGVEATNNNSTDIVRVRVTGKGGAVTRPVT